MYSYAWSNISKGKCWAFCSAPRTWLRSSELLISVSSNQWGCSKLYAAEFFLFSISYSGNQQMSILALSNPGSFGFSFKSSDSFCLFSVFKAVLSWRVTMTFLSRSKAQSSHLKSRSYHLPHLKQFSCFEINSLIFQNFWLLPILYALSYKYTGGSKAHQL